MGVEYQIKVQLTSTEKEELRALLKQKSSFRSTTTIEETEYFQFWIESSAPDWPDIKISFDEEGIYVCKSLSPELWTDLEDIHKFLQSLKKNIEVEEL
jgi:hypothetical protein